MRPFTLHWQASKERPSLYLFIPSHHLGHFEQAFMSLPILQKTARWNRFMSSNCWNLHTGYYNIYDTPLKAEVMLQSPDAYICLQQKLSASSNIFALQNSGHWRVKIFLTFGHGDSMLPLLGRNDLWINRAYKANIPIVESSPPKGASSADKVGYVPILHSESKVNARVPSDQPNLPFARGRRIAIAFVRRMKHLRFYRLAIRSYCMGDILLYWSRL